MFKRVRVKLYPTVKQKQVLEDHFNAYRFVYNLSLEYKQTLWQQWKKGISKYDMAKEVLELRKDVPWLLKCKAECVREASHDLDATF